MDGAVYEGMSNLGVRPTVSSEADAQPGLETHLFAEAEELYGREIRTELLAFLREEKRFSSPEELREQLKRDEEAVRAFFDKEISC